MPTDTAPIINSGPELFEKVISLSASVLVKSLSFLISDVIFAPTGYPLVMPMVKAKEAQPGTLKSGRIIGSSSTPTDLIKPVPFNRFEATKKGNKDGNTTLSHRLRPFAAAVTDVFENIIRHSIKITQIIGKKSFLIYIILKLFVFKNKSANIIQIAKKI